VNLMSRRLMFALIALGLMPGCSAASAPQRVEGELGELPAVAARICAIRPPSEAASEMTLEITDNRRLVGATRGGTFVCWLAAPGDHQITGHDDTGPTLLRARAGHRYWLHQEVAKLDGAVHAHLDWVDDAVASEMLAGCTRVRVAVPGHPRTDIVAVTPRR
jgi:hypothetical protein